MAAKRGEMGLLKVVSVMLRLPKAQKVTWTISLPGEQQPVVTTSNEGLSKYPSQTWNPTVYSFPVSEDDLHMMSLWFAVSTKSTGIEKKKNLLGEIEVDLKQVDLCHSSPSLFEADIGPECHVTISFILQGASLLLSTLSDVDLTLRISALNDVKALLSDPALVGRAHEYLASESLISTIVQATSRAVKSKSKKNEAFDILLGEVWHKFFELSIFSRFGQHLPEAPITLLNLLSNKPGSLFKGNIDLKTSILDALKPITSFRKGLALTPQFSDLLSKFCSYIATFAASNTSNSTMTLQPKIQRFLGVLIRVLTSYDPKVVNWLAEAGMIASHIHLLLSHWNILDAELLKQVLELTKFVGLTHRHKLDEHKIGPLIKMVATNTKDLTVQVSGFHTVQQLWPESQDGSSLAVIMASFRNSTDSLWRMNLLNSIIKLLTEITSSCEQLSFLFDLLRPIDSNSSNFSPTDISILLNHMKTLQPSHQDLLDSDIFKTIVSLLGVPSYPTELLCQLLRYWFDARVSSSSLGKPDEGYDFRNPHTDHETTINCLIERGCKPEKPKDVMSRISARQILLLEQESQLLLSTGFFPQYLPFWFKSAYSDFKSFALNILWHQPALLADLLVMNPDFLEKLLAQCVGHQTDLSPASSSPVPQSAIIIMAMKFEAISDDQYQFVLDSNWNDPWDSHESASGTPTTPQIDIKVNVQQDTVTEVNGIPTSGEFSEGGVVTTQVEDVPSIGSLAILLRGFLDVFSQRTPERAIDELLGKGIETVFARLQFLAITKVSELSLQYDLDELATAPKDDRRWYTHENWKLLCRCFVLSTRILRALIGHSIAATVLAVNYFALIDYRWKRSLFEPIIGSIFSHYFEPHPELLAWSIPIYIHADDYKANPNEERLMGSRRTELAIVLRNFLAYWTHALRKSSKTRGNSWLSRRLAFMAVLLKRLKKSHGGICIQQLCDLWSLLLQENVKLSHFGIKLLADAVLQQLGATESSTVDSAVLPCDYPSFIPPRIIFVLIDYAFEGISSYSDGFTENYPCLMTIVKNWSKLRFQLFCGAEPIPSCSKRFKQDVKALRRRFKAMTDEELAKSWDEISKLLDLYYVPHLFMTSDRTINKMLMSTLGKMVAREYLLKSKRPQDAILFATVELALDIHIMSPLVNDPVEVSLWDYLYQGLLKIPSEQIAKKVTWFLRRALFALHSTPSAPLNAPNIAFMRWHSILKYPSCVSMMAKLFAFTMEAYRAIPTFQFAHISDVDLNLNHVALFFNALLSYAKSVASINKDPIEFLEGVLKNNSDYVPINPQINIHGHQVRESVRPMFNLYVEHNNDASDNGATVKGTQHPFVRPNFVPTLSFSNFLNWAPTAPSGDWETPFASDWESRGYTGHITSIPKSDSTLQLDPFVFDEYPLVNELPEHQRTLNERDMIFSAFFEDALVDDRLLEAADPLYLDIAKSAAQAIPDFPFNPAVLYKNHLNDWFAPHRFEAYVHLDLAPTQDEPSLLSSNADSSLLATESPSVDAIQPQTSTLAVPQDSSSDSESTSLSDSASQSRTDSSIDSDSDWTASSASDPGVGAPTNISSHPASLNINAALRSHPIYTIPPIALLERGEVDEKKVELLQRQFRQQLLDAIEAICEALLPCLFESQGQFIVKPADRCMNPSLQRVVVAKDTLSLDPLFSLLNLFFDVDMSQIDPYTLDRVKFIPWIPVSLYWKWLGCMARLAPIVPSPLHVVCGKLTFILMKLDIETDMSLLSTMREPMMLAIATFGQMSSLPNFNPNAPRLLSSKAKDPLNDFTSINDAKRNLSDELSMTEVSQATATLNPLPSSTFFFEDTHSLPSFLVHYLPLMLDQIEVLRVHMPTDWTISTAFGPRGQYLNFMAILSLMIRGYEAHCFQLAQFLLNQFHWQPKQAMDESIWARAHVEMGNILAAVVRNASDVDRLLALKSFPVHTSLHPKLGDLKTMQDLLIGYCFGGSPKMISRGSPLFTIIHALRHMTYHQVIKNGVHLFWLYEWLHRSLGVSPLSTKLQIAALPLFPALLTTAPAIYDRRTSFLIPLRGPLLYLTTIGSHPNIPPSIANHWVNTTLSLLPPSHAAEAVAAAYILQDLQSSNSTYLRSTLEPSLFPPNYDDSGVWPLEENIIRPCFSFCTNYPPRLFGALCMLLAWHPEITIPTSAEPKRVRDWIRNYLHLDIPDAEKNILTSFPTMVAQLQQGNMELQAPTSSVKSNGRLWKIPNITSLPAPITVDINSAPLISTCRYGAVVVDRIVTVWLEDRGITLPSELSRSKRPKALSPSGDPSQPSVPYNPIASSLKFWTMPVTEVPNTRVSPSSFCRLGYASKQAIEELTTNSLRAVGDVPESWAVDDWQSTIISEGSAWTLGFDVVDCDYRLYSSQDGATLSYDSFRNAICVESFLRTVARTQEAPTQVWIPLPSNRENLTIYPCISFYHTRRFVVEPIIHNQTVQ